SITGNTKALVQLRKQIDRALEDAEGYPLDDATYRELGGDEYEVLVTRARSREEMEKPRTSEEASESSEQLPWAQSARRTREQSE
ncbi:MAG: hypothetical protein ACRDTR_12545, partial [Rubrobacter sp.]